MWTYAGSCLIIQRSGKEPIMIRSMTGFGRCEVEEDSRKITVEMKSVNHRYFEVSIKMPKALNAFESAIRDELRKYIDRGKVDVFISYEDLSEADVNVKYNHEIAAEYMKYLRQMGEEFGLDNDIRVSTLSHYQDVFVMEEKQPDEEKLWELTEKAVSGACKEFAQARSAEGERLKNDLVSKLDGMLSDVDFITERSPSIVEDYKNDLRAKISELMDDSKIDESRLATEVAIYADKVCVDEELVRLKSHVEATKKSLEDGGSVGRKLDFLAQEMNREANTILSKTSDLEISDRAINLKTEIEKVREQIQNIE